MATPFRTGLAIVAPHGPAPQPPHLDLRETALGTEPVTSSYLNWHLRRYGVTVERIRRDRVLRVALAAGPEPLHLALVFNLSHTTASRYAAITRLLDDQIEQATGQRPAQPRYPSDEPTGIPGPQPR